MLFDHQPQILLPSQPSSSSFSPFSAYFSSSPAPTPRFPSASSSSSPAKALSPRAAQDLISRLDATPPLLPQNLANLITASSLIARVSIRSSAFFIELILESLRYSTTTSLGVTRRALISAVGRARAIHYNSSTPPPQISTPNPNSISYISPLHSTYFDVLDHYTNLGIYVVHHVFTMAELLSITGIDLTHSIISTGFGTAEGSVMLLDSIFGSNESSRALSAIIMLVRRELLHDPHFTPSHSSTLTGLVSLTKAITAFACLQLATTRRTVGQMKMRVVWDATIVAESESESSKSSDPIGYQLGVKEGKAHGPPSSTVASDPSIREIIPPVSFPLPGSHSRRQSIHKLSESEKSPLLPDLRSTISNRATRIQFNRVNSFNSSLVSTCVSQQPQTQRCAQEERQECEEIEFELTQFLDDGENQAELCSSRDGKDRSTPQPRCDAHDQEPDDVHQALYRVKRTRSYSGLQVYSGSDEQSSNPSGPSSAATYQFTRLTRTTTRTTTTTTLTSKGPLGKLSDGQRHHNNPSSHRPSNPHPSCFKSSNRSYPSDWSHDSYPTFDKPDSTPPQSRVPVKARRSFGTLIGDRLSSRPPKRTQDEIEVDPQSLITKLHGSKSMPSSPRRSPFLPLAKVVSRALARSKTHSDLTSMYLDPYYLVYPISSPASESTPSSPSSASEESSEQSDGPIVQPNVDFTPRRFPSTISDLCEEDESVASDDDSPVYEHPRSPVKAPCGRPPLEFTSPQTSSTSVQTIRTHRVSQAVSPNPLPPASDFPSQSLIKNLGRFMRYSSAAYGQQFLRIMGIGVDSFNYPNTKNHSANDHAFASHVGLAVDQIILSSFAEPHPRLGNEVLSPLVHYVSIDHTVKAVVLTCRGTLGLSDVLVDLTCEYEPISVEGGDPNASYLAHSGMLHSALRLRRESSTVHEVIKKALIDHPSYGLIITGHSLGGGVAALLAVLCSIRTENFLERITNESMKINHPPITTKFVTSFRSGFPPGRPIHSYTYGTPAVASLDLCQYTKGLVTTVCNGIDVVPTLSLGVLHDLKSIAVSLEEEQSVAIDIVTKVIGLYRPNHNSSSWMRSTSSYDQKNTPINTNDGSLEGGEVRTRENVLMKDHEIKNGVGKNRAYSKGYLDPALEGSHFGRAEASPELGDWLWSLRRTMKAVSDAEKLYPPGDVWHVESYEVFVVREDATKYQNPGSEAGSNPNPITPNRRVLTPTQKNRSMSSSFNNQTNTSSRTQGRRIILRACDDVQARFSEPIFGKTMFHDHIPSQYELVLELLEAAIVSSHPQPAHSQD